LKLRFETIEIFDWIKRLPIDLIDLTSSGAYNAKALNDLGLDIEELPLWGNNYYGFKPLKETIAARYSTDPDHIALTLGASMANIAVLLALTGTGDRIMIETPVYQPFTRAAEAVTELAPIWLPRTRQEEYHLSPDHPVLANKSFKILMLSNLHNPTGSCDPPETFVELAEIAAAQNGWIVVDEVFLPFIEGGEKRCAALLHDRIISTCSLTKVWGLPGLRAGWITARPDLVRKIEHLVDYFYVNQPFITDFITWRILSDDRTFNQLLEKTRKRTTKNWRIVETYLNDMPLLDYVKPAGGLSVLLRFRDGRKSAQFIRILREDYGTLVVPGEFFDVDDGFRLSFGCEEDTLRRGMEAVKEALADKES